MLSCLLIYVCKLEVQFMSKLSLSKHKHILPKMGFGEKTKRIIPKTGFGQKKNNAYYLKLALGRKTTHTTSNGLWGTELGDETLGTKLGDEKLGDEKLGDEAPARAPAGEQITALKNPLGPQSLGRTVWRINEKCDLREIKHG